MYVFLIINHFSKEEPDQSSSSKFYQNKAFSSGMLIKGEPIQKMQQKECPEERKHAEDIMRKLAK